MYWRDDNLVLPDMTEAQLEAMPEWRDGLTGYTELDDGFEAQVGLYSGGDPAATGSIDVGTPEPGIDAVKE
jgi:hypothetical protein